MQIGRENIEKVLEATDIVDLIQSYVQLKRVGSQFRANCPFHQEKTPSFYVTPTMQRFHCFGCGKGGDAIAFVRDYENLPFVDAMRKLATRAGITLEEGPADPREEAGRRAKGRLIDLHREVTAFLHELLMKSPDAAHAREYLKSRGFGGEMAARWALGWMPAQARVFTEWAKSRRMTARELVDAGLAALREEQRPQDGIFLRFRDRLMFPIRNEVGDVIAFSGRQLREDPNSGKYINSPETALFRKSNVLFALDRARKPILGEKTALLCEGQIDVIVCHESGIEHAIAPLGTAFTPQHAHLIRRYTKQVLICYDSDRAGLAAAEKAFRELAAVGLGVRVVEMPAGDDPDSFLRREGVEAFRARLAAAREFFDFKLGRARAAGLLEAAASRTAVARECAEMLAAIPDPMARDAQIQLAAGHLQMPDAALREEIAQTLKRERERPRGSPRRDAVDPEEPARPAEPTRLHRSVEVLCRLALRCGQAQHFLSEQFEALHSAKPWLEGIPLLESILCASPDPASPASINSFLASLPPEDHLALVRDPDALANVPLNGLQEAEHALALLCAIVLHRRDAAVKAELKKPGLAAERMIELLEESKEIARLMQGTTRFQNADVLPPSTFRPKPPPWKNRRAD